MSQTGADATVRRDVERNRPSGFKAVNYISLFRYATALDRALLVVGTVCAIAFGQVLPGFAFVMGRALDDLAQVSITYADEIATEDDRQNALVNAMDEVNMIALVLTCLGAAGLVLCYGMIAFWEYSAVRQTAQMRRQLLYAVLRQDIAYFDTQASQGHLLNTFDQSVTNVYKGMGSHVAQLAQHIATFVGSVVIALIANSELTGVMMATLPILVGAGYVLSRVTSYAQQQATKAYAKAGTVADQNISKIRTVVAASAEERCIKSYTAELQKPQRVEERAGVFAGIFSGGAAAFLYLSFALAMWYGSWKIRQGSEEYTCVGRDGSQATCIRNGSSWTGGEVWAVLNAILIGGMSLGQGAPHLVFLQRAAAAGTNIFEVIDAKPTIDQWNAEAKVTTVKPNKLKGSITLHNVYFAYPTKPDTPVLRSLQLSIGAGQTVALVGSSGCGKSTITNLLLRFYDPTEGAVLVDGRDIREYDLHGWRQHIGLVSQEPRLFACSIRDNIAYGKQHVSDDEIVAAAKTANAHEFIQQLPEGYSTWVGEAGVQLSGGQKQRVAIARAILRDPPILILDEATSALDTKSEKVVQAAIDSMVAGAKRTTIIIAHRLSTIRNADLIAVMRDGQVVETGTHEELMSQGEEYATLVQLQLAAAEVPDADGKAAATTQVAPPTPNRPEDHEQQQQQTASKPPSVRKLLPFATSKAPKGDAPKSKSKALKDVPKDSTAKADPKAPGLMQLLQYNRPEMKYLILGLATSAAAGCFMPMLSLAFAKILSAFEIRQFDSISGQKRQAEIWIIVLVAAAGGIICIAYLQALSFTTMGSRLTLRIRSMLMRAMMYQEMAWFDDPDHTSGVLTNRLQSEAAHIRGAVGDSLAVMLQNIVSLIAGLTLSMLYAWQVALVVLGTLPFMVIAGAVAQKYAHVEDDGGAKADTSKAVSTVSEAIKSIKVVQAFGLQDEIQLLYHNQAAQALSQAKRESHFGGISLGLSNFILMAVYALAFWFGGKMMRNGTIGFEDFLISFFAILFAAAGAGEANMRFPDVAKAGPAASSVFSIINRKSLIDASSADGAQLPMVKGAIRFEDVTFAYPFRPNVMVFRSFSLDIPEGKKVALVGESGSGKSTIVSLIERFYDLLGGRVLLDSHDIHTLNLRWYRKQLGLVAQEPALFSSSIADNIKYGNPDATLDMVEAAAKVANAEEFIAQLQDGYNTLLGENGIQLSGGQKQRVAIARAVLGDPRILLLDEATSALDARSEAVVQEALDQVVGLSGRTTIAIAHRLSTIRHFDSIAVVEGGVIVEQGSHEELIGMDGGNYAALVRVQQSRA